MSITPAGYIVTDIDTIYGTATEPAPLQVDPWRHTIPATAALLALFDAHGGECKWFMRSGIACVRAEFVSRAQPGSSDIRVGRSYLNTDSTRRGGR